MPVPQGRACPRQHFTFDFVAALDITYAHLPGLGTTA